MTTQHEKESVSSETINNFLRMLGIEDITPNTLSSKANLNLNSKSLPSKANQNSTGEKMSTFEFAFPVGQMVARKILAVMEDVGYVQKTGYNDYQKYSYSSERDLLDALRPAMVKHGLVMYVSDVRWVEHAGDTINAVITYCLFDAESGDCIYVPVLGSGADKGDKAAYKLMTGALKYILRQTFLIPTGDDPEATDEEGNDTKKELTLGQQLVKFAKRRGVSFNDQPLSGLFEQYNITIDSLDINNKSHKKIVTTIKKAVEDLQAQNVDVETIKAQFAAGIK